MAKDKEKIYTKFRSEYPTMKTNKIVKIIDKYGEHEFFMDLISFTDKDFYVRVSLQYHFTKQWIINSKKNNKTEIL